MAHGGPFAILHNTPEANTTPHLTSRCRLMLIMVTLLAAESFFTRKGSFSGAGAAIVWPLQAR